MDLEEEEVGSSHLGEEEVRSCFGGVRTAVVDLRILPDIRHLDSLTSLADSVVQGDEEGCLIIACCRLNAERRTRVLMLTASSQEW